MNTIEEVDFENGKIAKIPDSDELETFLETLSEYVPESFFEPIETVTYKNDGGQELFTVYQDEDNSSDLGFAYGSALADNGYALVGIHKHKGETERANGFTFTPIIQTSDTDVENVKVAWKQEDFKPLEER